MYCHNLMQKKKKKSSVFHWGKTHDAALNLYLLSVLFQIPFSCVHCTCDPINYNRGPFYILSSVSIYRIITEFEVYLRSSGAIIDHYCMGMKELWNMKFSLLSRKNSVKVGWNLLPQMLKCSAILDMGERLLKSPLCLWSS